MDYVTQKWPIVHCTKRVGQEQPPRFRCGDQSGSTLFDTRNKEMAFFCVRKSKVRADVVHIHTFFKLLNKVMDIRTIDFEILVNDYYTMTTAIP